MLETVAGPKLVAHDVGMEYYQPRTDTRLMALGGVSLAIREGEFVSIVGPSGCGKTTFLNVVDGLVRPTRGRVVVGGAEVTGPGRDRAMVFQEGALLPWKTVVRNVAWGLECRGHRGKDAEDRARHFVRMVGLEGFEHHYPHELSGGMQQRVNLARALAVEPQMLLMDEPFAALDAQTRELMQAELLNICKQAGRTVLFITHQINEAVYLSDRVIVFSARPGRVLAEIPIEIARPRELRVKRNPQFLNYEDHIWQLIESEARKTMSADDRRTMGDR